MWFNIDWNVLAVDNIPPMLRKPSTSALAQIILKPLGSLYYQWHQWRKENIYKLEHTGQVCSLEGSLNDKFDPIERRIYITDGQLYSTYYVYTEIEEQDRFINTQSEESTVFIRTESETADTGLDFIVFVPDTIYSTQIDALHAHVRFYKAGGRRYNIFIDE